MSDLWSLPGVWSHGLPFPKALWPGRASFFSPLPWDHSLKQWQLGFPLPWPEAAPHLRKELGKNQDFFLRLFLKKWGPQGVSSAHFFLPR